MSSHTPITILVMVVYMGIVVGISVYYNKRSVQNSDEYFIGGRSIGPLMAAFSAESSDMSGWLLMGLPGIAYFTGLGSAAWTVLGLALGTYLNWLITAKRLRVYSQVTNDAINLPDYLSERFNEQEKKPIMIFSSLITIVFFIFYAASCFVTIGKLFSLLFGANYTLMMIIGAIFIVASTYFGGFLATSASDYMQSLIMISTLLIVLTVGTISAGGPIKVAENLQHIPGFLDFFGTANPVLNESGQQIVQQGRPLFGAPSSIGAVYAVSQIFWGLGYFGVPQVLLRFMAIRDPKDLRLARRVATIWAVISLVSAILIGLIGRDLFATELLSASAAENIFIITAEKLLPAFLAAIMMSGILAATISSATAYLLISSSAISRSLYKKIIKKEATDQKVLFMARASLIFMMIFGILVALDPDSVIFSIVSFSWAGFGAAFGPIILFSLYSKNVTHEAALMGMLSGAIMVFVWKFLLAPLGGWFGVYELLPAFVVSALVIVIVSKFTTKDPKVLADYALYQKELAKIKE